MSEDDIEKIIIVKGTSQNRRKNMTNKTTSKKAGTAASKVLRDGRTGKASKTAAGSALSQVKKSGKKK